MFVCIILVKLIDMYYFKHFSCSRAFINGMHGFTENSYINIQNSEHL